MLILLVTVALYHVWLQDKGALAWPDEHLYRNALDAVTALARLDIVGFCGSLSAWGARPGETALRLIPAAIQRGLETYGGVSALDPRSLRIATLPNVATSALLGVAFYRLAITLFDSRGAATLSTGVFVLLANNNVWVRHVLPYDTALMILLVAMERTLRVPVVPAMVGWQRAWSAVALAGGGLVTYPAAFAVSRRLALVAAVIAFTCLIAALRLSMAGAPREWARWLATTGIIAGVGLSVYPGYYSFPVAVLVLVVLGGASEVGPPSVAGRLRAGLIYGFGVLSVMFTCEIVARFGDVSYLAGAYRLSQTITQGSFQEGYAYALKYLFEVEGPVGIVLTGLAVTYLIGRAMRAWRGGMSTALEVALDRWGIVFGALYLVYATQSTVLESRTFTGRYFKMYLPVLVLTAVAAIGALPRAAWRTAACGTLAAISIVSFASFAWDYSRVAYPNNVLHALGIGFEDVARENVVYETDVIPHYNLPVKAMTAGSRYVTHPGDRRFVIVNFGWFAAESDRFRPYVPPRGGVLRFEAPHFLTSPSARFEGFGIARRREFRDRAYALRIYEIAP